jgi:integrase
LKGGVRPLKHPNGYGTVVKLSGNRRNPFVVRKTAGWDDRGYPIYSVIGYFPTREAGLIALAEYNKDPYDVDKEKTTFSELYALWLEKRAHKLGASNLTSLKAAYKHCQRLYYMKYKAVKAFNMQECVDNCGCGYSTQGAIKNLFNHLDRFAFELDIINRCYSELVTSASIPETEKIPFTDEEVNSLWEVIGEPWVDSVIVFLYTGFRISELLDIKTANVDLAAGTIKGGIKTKAGKDRLIPIHSSIFEIIRGRVGDGAAYLFSHNGKKVSLSQYYVFWREIMGRLGINHTPHECRHTFRSRLDSAGANKRCIDLIMGHKSNDVGERVYTHKTLEELKEAIELITS